MSIVFHRLESPFDFTPELSFRGSTVGERFTVEEDPRWEEHSTTHGQRLSLGRSHIERRNREPVLDRETVEYLFGLLAKPTVFLGEDQHVHSPTMTLR